MSEALITSTQAMTACELLHRMEQLQKDVEKHNKTVRLLNSVIILREKMEMLDEQLDRSRREQRELEIVMDILSKAMKVLPTPAAVPLNEKVLLTVKEATAHTGVGQNRLRKIGKSKIGELALWDGNKLMFKREKLVNYLNGSFSI